jgi:hypothetical protein
MLLSKTRTWAGAIAASALIAWSNSATAQVCVGDCNGDGSVTVDEIVTMVNIALGLSEVSSCAAADPGGDGMVTVDEILTAVNNALNGCPPPTGCTSANVTVSLDFTTQPLAGVTVDLDYPAAVSIPGTGNEQSVVERVMDITGAGGFFDVADTDSDASGSDDRLRSSVVVVGAELMPGGFEVVMFDCVSGEETPVAGDFACAIVSASDGFGNPLDGIGCSLALEVE